MAQFFPRLESNASNAENSASPASRTVGEIGVSGTGARSRGRSGSGLESTAVPPDLTRWPSHPSDVGLTDVGLQVMARLLHLYFVRLPHFVLQLPNLASGVSLVLLYVFAMALAACWFVVISLISACTGNLITYSTSLGGPGSGSTLAKLAHAYVCYCILRVMALICMNCYAVGWEAYSGFPTVRLVLEPRRVRSKETSKQNRVRGPRALLIAPLAMLLFLSVLLALGSSVLCAAHRRESVCYAWLGSYTATLLEPTGRANRCIRFVFFIAFQQWVQQFCYLFPRWDRALLCTQGGRALAWCCMGLAPMSIFRGQQWVSRAVGGDRGIAEAPYILGLKYHIWDQALIIGWMGWFLAALPFVFRASAIRSSGFNQKVHTAGLDTFATMFKYTYVASLVVHYARGCLSSSIGPTDAQKDLVNIMVGYPLLLTVTWTLTYSVIVISRQRLLVPGAVLSFAAALFVCLLAEEELLVWRMPTHLGALPLVWAHLLRRWLRTFGDEVGAFGAFNFRRMAGNNNAGAEHQSRRVAMGVSWCLLAVLISFFLTLAVLAVVTNIQQRLGLFVQTIEFKAQNFAMQPQVGSAERHEMTIDHIVSHLNLTVQLDTATGLPEPPCSIEPLGDPQTRIRYATCGHLWHGLSLVDFSLFSLAAYFDSERLPKIMAELFPPWAQPPLRWQIGGFSASDSDLVSGTYQRLAWMQIDLPDANASVVAVRGTNPVNVNDYLEDVMLWTEPVALGILATFFPLMRAISRETSDMLIQGARDGLRALGVPPVPWRYQVLLEHIEAMPPERRVFITGHSLGGGVAALVGFLSGKQVVAISPPGVYYSLAKHGQDASGPGPATSAKRGFEQMHQSISVMSEGDMITTVFDEHAGLVQKLVCERERSQLSHTTDLACHMLEGTLCHLLRHCGDHRRRWHSCSYDFDFRAVWHRMRDALPERVQPMYGGKVAQTAMGSPYAVHMMLAFGTVSVWATVVFLERLALV